MSDKTKELKRLERRLPTFYKWGNRLITWGFWFWLLETITFLFIYGWHWRAIGIERYFDQVAAITIIVGLGVWFTAVNIVLAAIVEDMKSNP